MRWPARHRRATRSAAIHGPSPGAAPGRSPRATAGRPSPLPSGANRTVRPEPRYRPAITSSIAGGCVVRRAEQSRSARVVAIVAVVVALVTTAWASTSPAGAERGRSHRHRLDQVVHLNQVQVIGSHNSYHALPPPPELALRRSLLGAGEDALEYRHAPLTEQFSNQKARQIDAHAFLDSKGRLYANPLIRSATNGGPYDPAMNQPGINVLHIQ